MGTYNKTCKVCSTAFTAKLDRAAYCSKECRRTGRNQIERVWRAANKKNQIGETLECAGCSKPFVKSAHNRRYCSAECRIKTERDSYRKLRSCEGCGVEIGGRDKKFCSSCRDEFTDRNGRVLIERICSQCGKRELVSNAHGKKFCSNDCAIRARLKAEEERRKDFRKICPVCNTIFYQTAHRKKYCSQKCQKIGLKTQPKVEAIFQPIAVTTYNIDFSRSDFSEQIREYLTRKPVTKFQVSDYIQSVSWSEDYEDTDSRYEDSDTDFGY